MSDEPMIDRPMVDEAMIDRPMVDDAMVDRPMVDDAMVDRPMVDDAMVDEPMVDEPMVDEPGAPGAVAELDDTPPPGGRGPTIAAVAVLVVVAGLVAILATREPAANRIAESRVLGRVLEVAGPTLDGDRFDIAERRGRYVLVNFFATWCGPCIQEHDDLVAFHDRHVLRDAEVVSVVFEDNPIDVERFFTERGGDFPVLIGGDTSRIILDFAVTGVPESFLVGPDGRVLVRIVGGVTVDGLEQLLAAAKSGELEPA